MKKLITSLTLLLMFTSPSYAEWEIGTISVRGGLREAIFYVDFDRIRKVDGFVYYWTLDDYRKPLSTGDLSYKVYNQGDCKLFRLKRLNQSTYTQSMAGGTPSATINKPETEWEYPSPGSVTENILNKVCKR